ncbi:flagellar hook protein FlgE [Polycladidibacter hongkongensis]|uniref:flagellar hook protein FlgE n=1 Tax=Polycladidibacter hongkongensis TaxID=1647556 RepID=UPI00082FECB6|nr:flagellar hook-basal body complex protein [Pseudovibrio hongkongensis]
MSIYGAINAATTGLDAQSTALENISGNVANSGTTGYKRLDTTFSDLVSGSGAKQSQQVSGTVMATSRATNNLLGDIRGTDKDTYMAINGSGYFVVTNQAGLTQTTPDQFYTRAGDFELDLDRNLVNSGGYFLQGYTVNAETGATGDKLTPIKISDQPMAAKPSDRIDYQANLPSTPSTSRFNLATPNSQYLDPAVFAEVKTDTSTSLTNATGGGVLSTGDKITLSDDFTAGETITAEVNGETKTLALTTDTTVKEYIEFLNQFNGVSADIAIDGEVNIASSVNFDLSGSGLTPIDIDEETNDPALSSVSRDAVLAENNTKFLNSTITGGAVTVYDKNGTPVNVELRWALNREDQWSLYYNSAPKAEGTNTSWKKIGDVSFDAAGRMVTPADGAMSISGLEVNGVKAADHTLSFGSDKLTQYEDKIGFATSIDIAQNGYPAGNLRSISITADGFVTGNYANGKSQQLYKVPIATFAAEQELQRIDGAAFARTPTSGEPDFRNGGSIRAKAYEASNADIAGEFSKLIITQQAYSANSKVLSTANQMLDSVLNIVR